VSFSRTARVLWTGARMLRVAVPHGVRLVRAVGRYRRAPSSQTRSALVHEGAVLLRELMRVARTLRKPSP